MLVCIKCRMSMAMVLKDAVARRKVLVQVHQFSQRAICHEAIQLSNIVITLLTKLQGDNRLDLARSVAHNLLYSCIQYDQIIVGLLLLIYIGGTSGYQSTHAYVGYLRIIGQWSHAPIDIDVEEQDRGDFFKLPGGQEECLQCPRSLCLYTIGISG